MNSGSRAILVFGFPLAGPTCFAITSIPEQSRVGNCVYAAEATDSYSRSLLHTAQAMRASLFARATVALL